MSRRRIPATPEPARGPSPRQILNRLGFGIGPSDELARLARDGLPAWLDAQLAPPPGDDGECLQRLGAAQLRIRYDAGKAPGPEYPAVDENRPLETLQAPIETLWPRTDYKRPMAGSERFRPRAEVAAATLIRAVHSRWSLREVLADFWHNHFNVDASQIVQVAVALPAYDRDVIRAHALGNFREFLEAVATSTAMLYYLNNRSSRAGAANENYARELFELHTFGRGAYLNEFYNRWRDVPGALTGQPKGFIDQDVYEAARAFTGWTVEDGSGLGGSDRLPATGRFAYVDSWHDNYQKRVLATEFDPFRPALEDGRKVLDLVAAHPATARFVSGKLCRRLLGVEPSAALLAAASETWRAALRAPDQIARVVRTIVLSPEFARSADLRVRRPLDLVAALVRGAGMDFVPTEGLVNEMAAAGQRLFGWGAPTGHPEEVDYWLSSNGMRRRWLLVQGLIENRWGNGVVEVRPPTPASTWREAADAWAEHLLGEAPGSTPVGQILAGLRQDGATPFDPGKPAQAAQMRRVLGYLAMGPGFQRG